MFKSLYILFVIKFYARINIYKFYFDILITVLSLRVNHKKWFFSVVYLA